MNTPTVNAFVPFGVDLLGLPDNCIKMSECSNPTKFIPTGTNAVTVVYSNNSKTQINAYLNIEN